MPRLWSLRRGGQGGACTAGTFRCCHQSHHVCSVAQPAAASAAERNWSVYGQIQAAHKTRMAHRTADKLVFCHETMHTQQRMQDAGWSADVPRWESDEDSDDSEPRSAMGMRQQGL